ncbi:hypothetical protein UFOVP1004_11 [uncultured Caudovirales phage]|uniref:Uncharacterized protein n=1 Tax=uncultured Caudovirales phage TaxID=2100421 RepID=A0A6J5Q0W8_9CAUD|nr:hypothetical protein UFOVP1004_11 [uncultured Caudovirales phage]
MSLWTADLTKYGDMIRKWFPVAKDLAQYGAALFGDVRVRVDSVGQPLTRDDLVEIPVKLMVSVRDQKFAELVRCEPVRVHGNLSAKFPAFNWPEVSAKSGSIRVDWPEGSRAMVNVPAIDPLVASVTLHDDGTGVIEIQRGPDGAITY